MGVTVRIVIENPPDEVIIVKARGINFERRPVRWSQPVITEAVRGSEPLSVFAGRLLFAVSFVARKRDEFPESPGRYFLRSPHALGLRLVKLALEHVDFKEVTPTSVIPFDKNKRVKGVISGLWSNLSLYGIPVERYFRRFSVDGVASKLLMLMEERFKRIVGDVEVEERLSWLKLIYWERGRKSSMGFVRPEGAPYGVMIYDDKRVLLSKVGLSRDDILMLQNSEKPPIFITEPHRGYSVLTVGRNLKFEVYYVPMLRSIVYHKSSVSDNGDVLSGGILVEYVGNKKVKRVGNYVWVRSKFISELFVDVKLYDGFSDCFWV